MFEKLLKQWAKDQGFDVWSQDHAAVLNNLSKWLDKNATQQNSHQTDNGACENCGNNCWKLVCETCGEE